MIDLIEFLQKKKEEYHLKHSKDVEKCLKKNCKKKVVELKEFQGSVKNVKD